ncbi:MAG: hypothetical protein WD874_00035 [Parcubacteria group bacterium]
MHLNKQIEETHLKRFKGVGISEEMLQKFSKEKPPEVDLDSLDPYMRNKFQRLRFATKHQQVLSLFYKYLIECTQDNMQADDVFLAHCLHKFFLVYKPPRPLYIR